MSTREDSLRALQDIFPSVEPIKLQETLQSCAFNVEKAVELTLSSLQEGDVLTSPAKQVHSTGKKQPKAYSRLQSGAGLLSPSRRRSSSNGAPKQQQPNFHQPGSFASVLASGVRGGGQASSSQRTSELVTVSHSSAHQDCFAEHPWLDSSILESVQEACEGDMDKAKAWLVDMDPFVIEANELPIQLPPMYAAEDATGIPSAATNGDSGAANNTTEVSGSEDVYWAHRQGAMRLSREWRKLFRNAIRAARDGDHSTHRHLISQARAVCVEAERAHEEAAVKIEHVMNTGQGRGMWELDLHGLHAPEAVDAVNRRLQVLTSVPAQARRTSTLHIIAGRGTHSSDGEATVAPAVLRYLTQHAAQRGWRFAQRGGAFTVSLSWRAQILLFVAQEHWQTVVRHLRADRIKGKLQLAKTEAYS